jgi:hypothetical protein
VTITIALFSMNARREKLMDICFIWAANALMRGPVPEARYAAMPHRGANSVMSWASLLWDRAPLLLPMSSESPAGFARSFGPECSAIVSRGAISVTVVTEHAAGTTYR